MSTEISGFGSVFIFSSSGTVRKIWAWIPIQSKNLGNTFHCLGRWKRHPKLLCVELSGFPSCLLQYGLLWIPPLSRLYLGCTWRGKNLSFICFLRPITPSSLHTRIDAEELLPMWDTRQKTAPWRLAQGKPRCLKGTTCILLA